MTSSAAKKEGAAGGFSGVHLREGWVGAHNFYRGLGFEWNKSQHVFVMNLREEQR